MLLTNRLLLVIFFRAFCIKTIADEVQAQASKSITYSALNPNNPVEPAITVGSSVTTDDNSSWISSSGHFAFGFYGESDGFFVGIRLFVSPTETVVVWTARADLKRFSKDAFLNFTDEGLFVTPEKEVVAIPLFKFSSKATSANMLDDGNFVVFGSANSNISGTSSDSIIWRSFDFPSDTILGDQYLPCGSNLTSSAGEKDHSIGKYILNFPCGGASLVFYGLNSSRNDWDTGATGGDYNYLNMSDDGRLYLTSSDGNEKDIFDYKPNKDTLYAMIYRATLDFDNIFRLYTHNLQYKSTIVVYEIPNIKDKCQTKGICGVNSYCMLVYGTAECKCMPGFEIMTRDSQVTDCRRIKAAPSCDNLTNVAAAAVLHMEEVYNIAGTENLAYDVLSLASPEDCSNSCLNDCNCDAASFSYQKCLMLRLPLTSVIKDDNHPSVTFMKLAGAQSAQPQKRREVCIVAIILSVAATISVWIVVIAAFIGAYWFRFRKFREEWRKWEMALTEEIAPRYFSYEELRKGSNEFKQVLGKGGHGTVFKADLLIGNSTVPVAVKRLHGAEMEGEREFQAEMRLIGRAYHVNIVRLLGFCHDGPSRLIVYELMSRCSLAKHIFENRGRRPSWERRVAILLATARGIHYLHCECEIKIIHRDIKPENILIAEDWTAKIADFGLAKLLNRNQTREATRTLAVGTEGYVAPECEWEVDGRSEEAEVSEKADVYSYGIVVLETICSKRNREVKELRKLSLCEMVRESYAANELWKLVEGDEVAAAELEKLVKIGLLCVQDDPDARPVMEDVVMMLEDDIDVPTPSPL